MKRKGNEAFKNPKNTESMRTDVSKTSIT